MVCLRRGAGMARGLSRRTVSATAKLAGTAGSGSSERRHARGESSTKRARAWSEPSAAADVCGSATEGAQGKGTASRSRWQRERTTVARRNRRMFDTPNFLPSAPVEILKSERFESIYYREKVQNY